MSIIQKWIRFGSLFVDVMLALHILSGTANAAANDGIVLSPEDDSSVYMGCVMVDGNVSQDYADTVFLELENVANGEITELLLELPYNTNLWLPEGNYYVHAALSGDHFEIQYPSEITVSRYKAASLSLTVTPLEFPSLLEKQSSFVPKLPVPYPQQQQIWNYLLEITGNAYAAAGLMGNLYAESGLVPTNLQDACEASLGYEDGTYTEAVDSGSYDAFATDWAGYGLANRTCRRLPRMRDCPWAVWTCSSGFLPGSWKNVNCCLNCRPSALSGRLLTWYCSVTKHPWTRGRRPRQSDVV